MFRKEIFYIEKTLHLTIILHNISISNKRNKNYSNNNWLKMKKTNFNDKGNESLIIICVQERFIQKQ